MFIEFRKSKELGSSGLNNSSPQFTSLPVPYICENEPFNYNHGAFDADAVSQNHSFSDD